MARLKYSLLLLLTALIWGTSFVAQRVGMGLIEPHTFGFLRFALASAAMGAIVLLRDRRAARRSGAKAASSSDRKLLLLGGILAGLAMFTGSTLQQFGLVDTEPGKAGFITALYIVLVPVIGLAFGRKATLITALSVLISVTGLYMLCIKGDFQLQQADLYLILCAFAFSVQILLLEHYAPLCDPYKLTLIEFIVNFVLSGICALLFEHPTREAIIQCVVPLLYTGLLSSCVGYTLQTVAQSKLQPALASLLMSLESVFSVLAGAVLLGNVMPAREWIGCGLMFIAVTLSILGEKKTA